MRPTIAIICGAVFVCSCGWGPAGRDEGAGASAVARPAADPVADARAVLSANEHTRRIAEADDLASAIEEELGTSAELMKTLAAQAAKLKVSLTQADGELARHEAGRERILEQFAAMEKQFQNPQFGPQLGRRFSERKERSLKSYNERIDRAAAKQTDLGNQVSDAEYEIEKLKARGAALEAAKAKLGGAGEAGNASEGSDQE